MEEEDSRFAVTTSIASPLACCKGINLLLLVPAALLNVPLQHEAIPDWGYLRVSWHVCSGLPHRDTSFGARNSGALLLPYVVN